MKALIVGCGFVGEAAADMLHSQGCQVSAWTASLDSAARLSAQKPYPVYACDINAPEPAQADIVVDCVSSGRGGAEAYRRVYLDGARSLLSALKPARFIFTSSTSVYAQTDGEWVNEDALAQPPRETGTILRATEDLVLASGGTILRLGGLYGPGRSALLRKTLDGSAMVEGDGQRWLNFCHRDDAAAAVAQVIAGSAFGRIFNVADDSPIQQGDCVRSLAKICGRPAPETGPVDLNRPRGWTSKRVSNGRLRGLGWTPAHPSFLEWAAGARDAF